MLTRNILITDVGDCEMCTLLATSMVADIIPKPATSKLPKAFSIMVNVTSNQKQLLKEGDFLFKAEHHQIRFNGNIETLSQMRHTVINKSNIHQYCSIS